MDSLKSGFHELARHFVGLSGFSRRVGRDGNAADEPAFWHYSGFIMEFQGIWCFVTAGHCLEKLDKELRSDEIEVEGIRIGDPLGMVGSSSEALPFSVELDDLIYLDEREQLGVDFGLILLSDYFRSHLEAGGIIALTKGYWWGLPTFECEAYWLFGFPDELNDVRALSDGSRSGRQAYSQLVSLRLELVSEPPAGTPSTTHPRFISRVVSDEIDSIVGMSGGPIFGFRKHSDGEFRYWIVALQSTWNRKSRIAFGCPISTFAQFADKLVATLKH